MAASDFADGCVAAAETFVCGASRRSGEASCCWVSSLSSVLALSDNCDACDSFAAISESARTVLSETAATGGDAALFTVTDTRGGAVSLTFGFADASAAAGNLCAGRYLQQVFRHRGSRLRRILCRRDDLGESLRRNRLCICGVRCGLRLMGIGRAFAGIGRRDDVRIGRSRRRVRRNAFYCELDLELCSRTRGRDRRDRRRILFIRIRSSALAVSAARGVGTLPVWALVFASGLASVRARAGTRRARNLG